MSIELLERLKDTLGLLQDYKVVDHTGKEIDDIKGTIEHLVKFVTKNPKNLAAFVGIRTQQNGVTVGWPSSVYGMSFDSMISYKSTQWVRSSNGSVIIDKNQLPKALITRIQTAESFKFEKTFIISEDSWTTPETWAWIHEFFSVRNNNPKSCIDIRVVKEGIIRKVIKTVTDEKSVNKYFDMGIYYTDDSQQNIGFLNHNQLEYKLSPDDYKKSEQIFDDINKCAETDDVIAQMFANMIVRRLKRTG